MAQLSSAKCRPAHRARLGLFSLALLQASVPVLALETLDEQALSTVTAQDGLTLELKNPVGISTSESKWITDNGAAAMGACSGGVVNQHACTIFSPGVYGINGNPLQINATLDAFGGNGAGTAPGLALMLDWQPLLLKSDRFTLNTPTANYSTSTLGNIGMYSQGHLHLINEGGLFNSSGNTAQFDFSTQGDVIYRQGTVGSPELSFGNFALSTRFTNGEAGGQLAAAGKVGITSQGLEISAPYTDTNLQFDLMFKGAPASAFDKNGRQGILHFGWLGGLVNPLMRVSAGGAAYGTYNSIANNPNGITYAFQDVTGSGGNARSEGLNIFASWDFDSDFAWIIGQAGGNQTQARFTKWRRMAGVPASTPMLSMPVTLDVIQNNTGPAGLCFGGGFTSGVPIQASCTSAGGTWIAGGVPAGKAAIATMIRDGHLHAYNQQINVIDPTSAITSSTYNWGLVFTMGKLDGDIFLYPEGRAQGTAVATTTNGMKADITMAIQSPGYWGKANSSVKATRDLASANWSTNTHFMLADTAVGGDTAKQYGVGLINADLLWSVRDMYFRVINGDTGYPDIPGGIWMQTDTKAVYQFRGLFGGGNLLDLSNPTGIALMDIKLATTRFIFALHPKAPIAGDAPIGFTGLLDLDTTAGNMSYLSLAEMGSPTSAFKMTNITGRIGWKNGTVNLISGQNSADGLPSLAISNDLLFGSSANFGSGGGAPVVATVGFGSENFGRIALPGGTWHSDVSIKIPTN